MGTYLLIEFEDDSQAERLCAQINAATAKGKRFWVAGLFKKPMAFCKCTYDVTSYRRQKAIQGIKHGWWICPTCRRPRFGNQTGNNQVDMFNLTEVSSFTAIDPMVSIKGPLQFRMVPQALSLVVYPEKLFKGKKKP